MQESHPKIQESSLKTQICKDLAGTEVGLSEHAWRKKFIRKWALGFIDRRVLVVQPHVSLISCLRSLMGRFFLACLQQDIAYQARIADQIAIDR